MTVTLLDKDITPQWFDAAKAARIVGMDIETSGLDRNKDRIATIQIFVPEMGTVMVRHMDSPVYVMQLLEARDVIKIFHHAPFDLGFLMRDYPVLPTRIADTKVAAKVLDPKKTQFINPDNGKGSHSLLSLVWYYFEDKLDKSLVVSNWFADDLSPAQLEYAAKDVIYLPELLRRLELELSKKGELRLARDAYKHIPTKIELERKNLADVYEY